MHPSRLIRGCARHLRATLLAHRIFGKVRFADLAEKEADKVGELCESVSREASELETVIASAVADGKVTPDELDAIVRRCRKIGHEVEEGRPE
jgi:hypothetical protein